MSDTQYPSPSDGQHFLDRGERDRLRPTSAKERAQAARRAAIRREPLRPQDAPVSQRIK